ncbi:MAG: branched-chain amino acid ABC transporter ATP-binding protein [Deltaproteobacteria bacterium]|nr:MAG: branched-chain amino acid ABC transporter ATP-binding protein [Deltaproteobacteria bacterium]
MLKVNEIKVNYGGIPALHEVSFEVKKGELVAIVGANGAGKTTALKTVVGTLSPVSGDIEFEGIDITGKKSAEIVQLGITYVPEGRHIFGPLTVEENLLLGAFTTSNNEEIKERMDYVYQLFPILKERYKQKGETLSGGEQQMLAIGRGLMARPKLLMLDEPSLGLMPKLVAEVFEAISLLKEQGHTILLVEQNVREALELADRGYILQTGRTIHSGLGRELLESEIVKKAFLGL